MPAGSCFWFVMAIVTCSSTSCVELPDVHEAALKQALKAAASPQHVVIFTIMDGNMASLMFPPFWRSLRHSGDSKHLLVICQDDAAYAICASMHQKKFCIESVANGAPLFRDESSNYHHQSCWRKPYVALAILELGYNILCLDVDIIAFKPLLPAIDWSQDLMAASDCNQYWIESLQTKDLIARMGG
ncbi:hypothetical protein WJX84_002883 [Apatococcus fuscideae]|uniref:Glycosyltransferase n=1 Tax=Apatococcus fuscideae TaxID=2026836 RepID=A0AAW1SUB9_9CHLO